VFAHDATILPVGSMVRLRLSSKNYRRFVVIFAKKDTYCSRAREEFRPTLRARQLILLRNSDAELSLLK
jgi:hypothetical protein